MDTPRPDLKTRVAFVNSGILGHRSVARLIREAVESEPALEATHIDLSEGLTIYDRIVRRLLCAGFRGSPNSRVAQLTLGRWRAEWHSGLLAARRLRRIEAATGGWDVLHFHPQATAYASLRRMRRTPAVVSLDCTQRQASLEVPSAWGRRSFGPGIRHDGAVYRAAAEIIATSRWAADDLARCHPECAAKLQTLPYPVRLTAFDPGWAAERRDRATRPGGMVRALFMGGDFPRKGGPELLRAWQAGGFAERATLMLVTNWPLAAEAVPRGVDVRRNIAPYTPEWYACWREADLFVMPTLGEAFGMVYQEAGAASLPSIGTRLNAIPEIIEEGRAGLLVTPGVEGELVNALERLIDSAELRQSMGEAARTRMERVARPEDYASRLIGTLFRACGRTLTTTA